MEMKSVEFQVLCFHQIYPPEISRLPPEMRNGRGDCSKCKYDPENNGKCSSYIPKSIIQLFVHPLNLEKSLEEKALIKYHSF